MNLRRDDIIAGYPAKKIRDLLTHCCGGTGVTFVAYQLKIEEKDAIALLNQLRNDGYLLEACDIRGTKVWTNTRKGNALALAKFMKPIPRDRAQKVTKE